jgi:hypothetical protein
MFKTGTDALSGAVSGNMKTKKRLTQNILPDMIIRAQDGVTSNIMIDFKSLCSTSTAYQHGGGKFGGGVEVRQEHVRRNYRTAVQYLDLTENGNTPGTIGPAEEILNTYGDRGSGCTGLIIGKHGNLSSAFLRIRDLITKSLASRHCNFYCIAPHHAQGMFNVRSTAVGD